MIASTDILMIKNSKKLIGWNCILFYNLIFWRLNEGENTCLSSEINWSFILNYFHYGYLPKTKGKLDIAWQAWSYRPKSAGLRRYYSFLKTSLQYWLIPSRDTDDQRLMQFVWTRAFRSLACQSEFFWIFRFFKEDLRLR